MNGKENHMPLPLVLSSFFFLFFLAFFRMVLTCFLWCTFEANENAPLGGILMCSQIIGAKSHWTSIERTELDTKRTETEQGQKIFWQSSEDLSCE